MNASRTLTAAALAALLAGCSILGLDGLGEERDALRDARVRWGRADLDAYAFTLQRGCFCPMELIGPVRIVVRGDSVLSRTYTADGTPVPAQWAPYFGTMEEVFELIDEAIDRSADDLRVSYHRTLGYPVKADIDYVKNAVDDELSLTVSDFTIQ